MTDYTPRTADEARELVAQILASKGIKFECVSLGERIDPWDNGDRRHKMDAWNVTMSREFNGQRIMQHFDFFTGDGLRKRPKNPVTGKERRNPFNARTQRLDHQHWERRYPARPVAPHPADALQCLLLDSSASEQTFASWCDELGYDSDSRKAYATYEACQQSADKLAKLFDHEARAQLRDALQDY